MFTVLLVKHLSELNVREYDVQSVFQEVLAGKNQASYSSKYGVFPGQPAVSLFSYS